MGPAARYQISPGIKQSGPCVEPLQVRPPSHSHGSDQFGGEWYFRLHNLVGVVGFEPTLDGF